MSNLLQYYLELTSTPIKAMEEVIIPKLQREGFSNIDHEPNSFTSRINLTGPYSISISTIKFSDWNIKTIDPNGEFPIETALMKNNRLIYIDELGYSDIQIFESIPSLITEIRRLINLGDLSKYDD